MSESALADGVSARTVATKLEVSRPTIAKWRRRFFEDGVEGLEVGVGRSHDLRRGRRLPALSRGVIGADRMAG